MTTNTNKNEIETEFLYPYKVKGRTTFYVAKTWNDEEKTWKLEGPGVNYVLAPVREV